jgi:ribosome biogenesis GTPase
MAESGEQTEMYLHNDQLERYGWNDHFAKLYLASAKDGYAPARVLFEDNLGYRIITANGELTATAAGRLRHAAANREELPAVGDWVAVKEIPGEARAVIHLVLPRRSQFVRKAAGQRTDGQVVGSNIETVFLVTSLNHEFNARRIERYLTLAWESGASPVIVLSKADLCDEVGEKVKQAQDVARAVPVHAVSPHTGLGVEELATYLRKGETVALLGSSGVGKSTLINRFLGYDRQLVREVREHDDRGQHTTRHRELILLPNGALVLDTPGMRELQMWEGGEGLQLTFEDIDAFAVDCHFRNCSHASEPQCEVQAAISDGRLAAERFESYRKLQGELAHFRRRHDEFEQRAVKQKWKQLTKMAKNMARQKRNGGGA